MKTLPNKLSDLLELAVRDAQKCEALPGQFRLEMGDWVKPLPENPGVCAVCMGGAVMLQSLDFDATSRLDPANYPEIKKAIWAIDSMRLGDFEDAASEMGLEVGAGEEKALLKVSRLVRNEREDNAVDDGESVEPEWASRASWGTYLGCAITLREAGL